LKKFYKYIFETRATFKNQKSNKKTNNLISLLMYFLFLVSTLFDCMYINADKAKREIQKIILHHLLFQLVDLGLATQKGKS